MGRFKNPAGAVQRAVQRTKASGSIVLTQPAASGITSISSELGREPVFTADELKRVLLQQRLRPSIDSFETQLDVTACLHRTGAGLKIISDCVGRDVRKVKEAKLMRILKAFWRVAQIGEDGSAHVKEPCTAFVVTRPHLQPVPGG